MSGSPWTGETMDKEYRPWSQSSSCPTANTQGPGSFFSSLAASLERDGFQIQGGDRGFSPKCSQKEGLARERDEFFHEETHPFSSSESRHGIPLSLLMVKPYSPSVGVCRGPANPAQPALRSEPPDTPRKDGCCHPILPVPVINASRNAGSLARSGGGVVSRASNSRICSPEPREIQMMGLFVFS